MMASDCSGGPREPFPAFSLLQAQSGLPTVMPPSHPASSKPSHRVIPALGKGARTIVHPSAHAQDSRLYPIEEVAFVLFSGYVYNHLNTC